jgi:hypothetical protein
MGVNGLTYPGPKQPDNLAGNIIMLCDGPLTVFKDAGFSPRWTDRNDQRRIIVASDLSVAGNEVPGGVDGLQFITSKTLLHELMHAVDYGVCKLSQSPPRCKN